MDRAAGLGHYKAERFGPNLFRGIPMVGDMFDNRASCLHYCCLSEERFMNRRSTVVFWVAIALVLAGIVFTDSGIAPDDPLPTSIKHYPFTD